MGILDLIKNTKKYLAKDIRLFNAGETAPNTTLGVLPTWFFNPMLGVPRRINLIELRQYAKSCWVQMVVNAIIKQIMIIDWDIISSDEEDETDYSEDINKLKTLLNNPNRNGDAFWDIWGPFLRDVLEIDAGVIQKGRNVSGELVELFVFDGGRFLINTNEHGIIGEDADGNEVPAFYQYSFRQIQGAPIPFNKDEIIYGKINTLTESPPYGWSPLQSIQQEVEVMIQSTRYNKEFFKNNATPDGIVSVNMDLDNLRTFQGAWESQVKGKPHKLVFHNSDASFTPLSLSNKDMDWLEGQKWYFHVVFGSYGLSPQEVGFYENSNKSTGESQERITIKNAVKPYLKLIEQKINRDIRNELIGHDKIKFEWFPQDSAAEKVEHEQTMAKLAANVITINEVRAMEGLEPVDWGDEPMAMMMQQQMIDSGAIGGNDDKDDKEDNPKDKGKKEDNKDNKPDRDKKKEEREKEKSIIVKEAEIDAGEEMIDEADGYVEFLRMKMEQWEKKILSFLEETLKDEIQKDYIDKSFGDFISRLFNSVNTVGFMNKLMRVIKLDVKKGIKAAEEELDMDIGVGVDFDKKVKLFADRQLDGFTIDGKRWKGLKGVAQDVQNDVSNIVANGINEKQGVVQIRKDIQELFIKNKGGKVKGKVTKGRAMRIARTESNRFINAGKLSAYKDSGLKGKKVWVAFIDKETTDICRDLNGQKRELHGIFEFNGKNYEHPPHGPNCRSVIEFELD